MFIMEELIKDIQAYMWVCVCVGGGGGGAGSGLIHLLHTSYQAKMCLRAHANSEGLRIRAV